MTRGGYAILLLIEHAATSINASGVLVLRYTYLECCLRHQMGPGLLHKLHRLRVTPCHTPGLWLSSYTLRVDPGFGSR